MNRGRHGAGRAASREKNASSVRTLLGRGWARARGAFSPMVAILIVVIFMLAALVIDGGRALNVRARAQSYAQEAARAAANGIDLTQADAVVDQQTAAANASAYCNQLKAALGDSAWSSCGLTSVTSDKVTAEVTITSNTSLMGMFGKKSFDEKGTATVTVDQGVTQANQAVPQPNPVRVSEIDNPPPVVGNPVDPQLCPQYEVTIYTPPAGYQPPNPPDPNNPPLPDSYMVPVPAFPGYPDPLPAVCVPQGYVHLPFPPGWKPPDGNNPPGNNPPGNNPPGNGKKG